MKKINIFGAGIAGLTAAINIAKEGHNVIVYEKEKFVGGAPELTPSIQITPADLDKINEYINIDISPCFSKLDVFKGYIYSKKIKFDTNNLYLVERGCRKTSIEYFLYQKALKEGVKFKFSHPLATEDILYISDNSIIATGGDPGINNYFGLKYLPNRVITSTKKTKLGTTTIAYFDKKMSYYGYMSTNNGMLSAHLAVPTNIADFESQLNIFSKFIKDTEGIELKDWLSHTIYLPRKFNFLKRTNGKNIFFVGQAGGFVDPFFNFGINGALLSGKLAAKTIIFNKIPLKEFKQFKKKTENNFVLSTVYWYFPFKDIIIPNFLRFKKFKKCLIFNQKIPGFNDKNWLKVANICDY